jgi:hypothetical protein
MPDAFVYIDESQSPDSEAAQPGVPFRIGLLVLESPIDIAICPRAMRALAGDSDAVSNEQDKTTLERGYFHASIDSKNAHSALCNSIAMAKLNAHFMDMQWRFDPPAPRTSSETERVGGLHSSVNMLGTMSVLDDDYAFVYIEVARRAGTFDTFHAKHVAALFDEERLGSIIQDTAQIRARFPGFDIQISDGASPGIQVCDFLLWTVQRTKLRGDDRWQRRVGLRMLYESKEVDGHQAKGTYALGQPGEVEFLPNSVRPRAPQTGTMPFADITTAMLEIEADVRRAHAEAMAGNRRIIRHADALTTAVNVLDGKDSASVVAVARSFILICDTLPMYDPTDVTQATRASEKRLVAAFVMDDRFVNCVRTRDHWDRWLRQRLQAAAPKR